MLVGIRNVVVFIIISIVIGRSVDEFKGSLTLFQYGLKGFSLDPNRVWIGDYSFHSSSGSERIDKRVSDLGTLEEEEDDNEKGKGKRNIVLFFFFLLCCGEKKEERETIT